MTRHIITPLLFILCTLTASSAYAQQPALTTPQEGEVSTDVEDARWSKLFRPGTLDAQVTLGMGTALSPTFEPSVDLGLIPLGTDNTLSIGASVGMGYCLGCLILSALPNLSVRSWSIDPQVRVLGHFGSLVKSINIPEMDLYGGLVSGVSIYHFRWIQDNPSVEANGNVLGINMGLLGGMHYLLNERVYIGAELKYLLTLRLNEVTVEVDGTTYSDAAFNNYIQNGMEYTFHLGARF